MASHSRQVSVPIERPVSEVYEYVCDPTNLPEWAAGLAGSVERVDGRWVVDSPMGTVVIAFVERNRFGILDHDVTLPSGERVTNPMRVVADGSGCEVVFTVRRRSGMSEADLARDAEAVSFDLATLKRRLEDGSAPRSTPGRSTVAPMTAPAAAPVPPRLDAVGVVVADLPRAIAFYTALGCTFPDHSPTDGHTEADLGGVRLMLDTEESVRGFWPGSSWAGRGRVSLAARCASPQDVDRLHSELALLGAGSEHEPFDAPWGMRYATVRDPDGSSIDLYAGL